MIFDNFIQTFQIEKSGLRGRFIRMDGVVDALLTRHAYPQPVSQLCGEAALLSLLLSSMLKYDGIFTLQVQGDGPVGMLVADIHQHRNIRACAKFKADDIPAQVDAPYSLLGRGHIAFTVDQGDDTERYQGIVALAGASLQESIQHYFTQSEQITTGIRMAVGRDDTGKWVAAGMMLQLLPEQRDAQVHETREGDWRRAMVLMQSCTDHELTDTALSADDLLYRLFHEDGVRIFGQDEVVEKCRCSEEKAKSIIAMMSPQDRVEMTIDGKISVQCEFCNRDYQFESGKDSTHVQKA